MVLKYLGYLFFTAFLILNFSCKNSSEKVDFQRPNILFAIADDQSFGHSSAYGCQWINTPAFDSIAKNGLLFMNAYTSNAKCSPSRASILTGRNSWQLEEATNHWSMFPEKFKSFPEVLSENGYKLGRTGKGWAPGIALKDGEPRELIAENYIEHKLEPPAKYISDNDYAENFRSFLDESSDNDPFFFWYGAIEPHRFYDYGAGIRDGGKKLDNINEIPAFWPDNDSIRTDMLDYAFEVEHFDMHLGKMMKMLEDKGIMENTIIIVTSDNGMPFPRIKGQIYAFDNHLPLAIYWGNGIKNPGRIIEEYINFSDFAPTFLDVAGIDPAVSGMAPIIGKSLRPLLKGENEIEGRDYILIGKERHDIGRPNDEGYPVRGIVKGKYAYTINFKPDRWPAGNPETGYLNTDGGATKTVILNHKRNNPESKYWEMSFGKRPDEELYNIEKDPFCMDNLASEEDLSEVKEALKAILYHSLTDQKDPRIMGNGDIFDKYQYADQKTVNFYERFKKGELGPDNARWVEPTDFEK